MVVGAPFGEVASAGDLTHDATSIDKVIAAKVIVRLP